MQSIGLLASNEQKGLVYTPWRGGGDMGFKYTSETFQISAGAIETAPNTLQTTTINQNLDSLSREILVIQYVDMDFAGAPDLVAGVTTILRASLNNSDVGAGGLANSQVIATSRQTIVFDGVAAVSFSDAEPRNGNAAADQALFVSATDDLFLSVVGSGNVAALGNVQCRIFARRAVATADTYAAILTSQFNS